jgi:NADPH-dependent 2,4-dienoyl-CoA reductase/sulfur reductase-like enzyme
MIERQARVHGVARTLDEVIIPALRLAEIDRRKGALEPARERFVYEHVRRLVEAFAPPASANAPASLCIVAAHDEADHIAALGVAKLFAASQACVVGAPALAAEVARTAAERRCSTVLISAVPPAAAHYAGYLARRLRRELPNVQIAVGLWAGEESAGTTRDRLAKLGVDQVLARISEAPNVLRQHASAANQERPDRAKRSAPR